MEGKMSYYVYVTQTPRYYSAEVPSLPGCRTIGRTEAEVIENIRDVVRGYYQSMRKRNKAVPRVKVVKVSNQGPEASPPRKRDVQNDIQASSLEIKASPLMKVPHTGSELPA
jgi:predicted RNase H-like HicB family nuclease